MKILRYIYVIFKRWKEVKYAVKSVVVTSPEYVSSEFPNFLKTKKTLVARVNHKSTDPKIREMFLNSSPGKNYKDFLTSK
jgi:hypothetical protein